MKNRSLGHYDGFKTASFFLTPQTTHAIVWFDAGSSEYRHHGHVPYNNRHNNNIHATFWRVGGIAKRQS